MYHLFKIPTGKDTLYKLPKDRICCNSLEFNNWVRMWQRMFLLIIDEDSMASRPIWAWFEHRSQVNRPWGGIPCVFSFGDYFQLPPVGMKGIHSAKQSNSEDSSDFVGK
eukprot:11445538-Ditylum_brightwellii.AAC.1